MQLNALAVWTSLDGRISNSDAYGSSGGATAADCARFAQSVETLGYSAMWIPEGYGRNPLVNSSWLLANTKSLIVATGIANLYARDAMAMAAARSGLNEQSDGRFLLGVGVSNSKVVSGTRGHEYGKPLATMRTYLEDMTKAPYMAAPPLDKPVTVIAALRDKMMELAAELTDGAHTFNVTPDHTAHARSILGSDKLLCVEQKLVLEESPSEARAIGRRAVGGYLRLEPYRNSMKQMGFTDDDMSNGGSDRLVDAMVGWGNETALRQRIQSHLDAGATQVCVNPVAADGGIDMRIVELLAPIRQG